MADKAVLKLTQVHGVVKVRGTGSVVLELAKISGYGSQQHQNQGDLG